MILFFSHDNLPPWNLFILPTIFINRNFPILFFFEIIFSFLISFCLPCLHLFASLEMVLIYINNNIYSSFNSPPIFHVASKYCINTAYNFWATHVIGEENTKPCCTFTGIFDHNVNLYLFFSFLLWRLHFRKNAAYSNGPLTWIWNIKTSQINSNTDLIGIQHHKRIINRM